MEKALRYNTDKLRFDLIPLDVLKQFINVNQQNIHIEEAFEMFQGGKDYSEHGCSYISIIGHNLLQELCIDLTGARFDATNIFSLPKQILEEIANVFTMGAKKYAPHNWTKGASWLETFGSLLRHYRKYCSGDRSDEESGFHHLAHAVVNAIFICKFYELAPWYDDRIKSWLTLPKIVLDVDDVVADFIGGYKSYFQLNQNVHNWYFSYKTADNLKELVDNKDFWVNLPVLNKPNFIPEAYVSNREIPVTWTEEFLEKNNFPCRPVYHLGYDQSKVDKLLELKTEIFIDDKISNVIHAQKAGITSFLMTNDHNRNFEMGYRRIYDLDINTLFRI